MQQINLPLEKIKTNYLASDFCIADCNILAYKTIIENFKYNVLYLHGEEGSGKTHLSHIWAEKNNGIFSDVYKSPFLNYIVEDLEELEDEERLFHLYNIITEKNGKLLITGERPIALLDIKLPDLRSRLLNTMSINLGNPDEKTLRIVLLKQLSDRQLIVADSVINHIIKNSARSFKHIKMIAEKLESISPINLNTIKKIIQ